MAQIQMTVAVVAVLQLFLQDPTGTRYGYELMKATGFASGKLYPILARLERVGWLERLEPSTEGVGGPPRVGYRIAPTAMAEVRAAVAEVTDMVAAKPRWAPHLPKWIVG